MERFPVIPPLALGWVVGAVVATACGALDAALCLAIAVAVLALGTALAALGIRTSRWPRRWLMVALALASLLAGASSIGPPAPPASEAGIARVRVRVLHVRPGRTSLSTVALLLSATTAQGGPTPQAQEWVGRRVALRAVHAAPGAELEGVVELHPRPVFLNPTPHPAWPSGSDADYEGRVLPPGLRQVRAAPWLSSALSSVRGAIREALVQSLDEPGLGLARALVLGEARALEQEDAQDVRGAGLAHVLAVSGLHVALVIGGLVLALRRAMVRWTWLARRVDPRRASSLCAAPLALVYAALAGGAPSAWRAALTAALALGLQAAGRRPRPAEVAAFAVLALAAVDPETATRPAFLLSVVATAAIVAGALELDPLRALLATSVRATLATAPLVLWCFGTLPVLGIAANLVVVPAASLVVLPLALAHALIALVSPSAARVSALVVDRAAHAFLGACEAFTRASPQLAVAPLDVAEGLIVCALAAALLMAKRWRTRLAAIALCALALSAAELRLRTEHDVRDALRITFLDVGQGDAALIDMPDGRLVLVDAGGSVGSGIDPGARVLLPLLRARRRSRVDVAILSHPHPDHYGGLAALLDELEIGEIWDTGQADDENEDGELAALLRRARARGVVIRTPAELCDEEHRFGEAELQVHWPCPRFDPGWGPNENSFVVELRFGVRRVVFTGDIEAHAEASLVADARLAGPIDVLKAPHHGSRTSSSEGLLALLEPRITVVSAGRGNRFGHPHPEVAARLASRGELFRVDQEGGTLVWTDGHALEVRGYSGRSYRLP